MNDADNIIQALREALELAPDKAPLRKHLADLLFQEGRFEEAEKEYRELVTVDPADNGVKLSLAESFYNKQKMVVGLVVVVVLMKISG
jgi:Flp pilus assembly protein TadD